ncbi:restriction endonuclease subunit S [Acinetobacter johnsonii]|uniref:restriction endonuclease subunit S n=1 Tax=Acinetobacter TaxID=469 RepID=UPI00376F1F2E
MSEWNQVVLDDVSSKIGDGLHGTPTYDDKGLYSFINGNNLLNGRIVIKPETKRITEEEYLKIVKPLDESTILISINGTIGNVAKYQGELCALGKSACYINLDTNLVNRDFFYYECLSDNFQSHLENVATGTTIPNVPLKGIRAYKFKLPSLPEQKAIASVLSSLDDKIDLLHRQNKTLEAMAETLFRQWFIEEAKEDWSETKVLDVFSLVGGGTPKTSEADYWDGDIPWLSGGDIANAHQGFIVRAEKAITELGLEKSSTKLLPKLASVISARGTVGKYAMLSRPMTFSQSNYGIIPKGHTHYYFVYLLLAYIVDELSAAAYGSVFDTITTRTFEDVELKLPPIGMITDFELEIAPLFENKLNNVEQIQTLENLRDTLLPKLMSGEVRVQYQTEQVA